MHDAPLPPFPSDQEAKEQIVEYGRCVADKGFVIATEGNLSALVSPDTLWITPADLNKGKLTTDALMKMKLDGTVLEGPGVPSSEAKMHLRVYLENPAARGVAHCHPLYATSFGIAGIALDAPILAEPMMALGPVPVAHYAKPGTYDVPDSIAPFWNDYNAVLLSNRLGSLVEAFALARRTRRIIIENLTWATLYNGLVLPFAALGWVTPLWAALGMSASSLLVVLNSLRIQRLETD